MTGIYSKQAMMEVNKYMAKRKNATIWILTETHLTKGAEITFKSIFQKSFHVFSKRRTIKLRKLHKISKKTLGRDSDNNKKRYQLEEPT